MVVHYYYVIVKHWSIIHIINLIDVIMYYYYLVVDTKINFEKIIYENIEVVKIVDHILVVKRNLVVIKKDVVKHLNLSFYI